MKIFYTTILLSFAFGACAQVNTGITAQQLTRLAEIATQDVPPRAPGIATGVVIGGQVVFKKYTGYANLNDSVLIGPQSRFNIASNGKQFTALAVLLLADQQKLKLDDDIRKYFPNLLPAVKEKISIQNLLTHTSGIRDVYDLWSLQGITWWKQTFSNTDALALLLRQQELNFTPGTRYSYSNSNYMLLALLVEKVSGESFVVYTTKMFRALNMPHTSFESDYKNIQEPIARPYFNFDTWTTYNWITNMHGDGNLFSTLEDQLTWEQTIQSDKSKFIPKRVLEQSQQLSKSGLTDQYGYGLEFGTYRGIPYRFHEGATGAWKATVVRFPEKNMSIVTLTNSGKTIPSMQTRQAADVLLNLEDPRETFLIAPEKAGAFVAIDDVPGSYQNENNFTFTFEKRDTSLFLIRSGRNDIRLERESVNVFHQWNDPAFKQEFTYNAKGELQVTAYYTTHAPYTLTRASADWSGFDYTVLNGTYTNDETGVSFKIRHRASFQYEIRMRDETAVATLLTPHKLLFRNYGVEILTDSRGQVTHLLLSGDRIQAVRFTRK